MTAGRFASLACLIALVGPMAVAQESGREATRSRVTVIGVDGRSERVVLDSPRRFGAPDWSPDGSELFLNSGGKLWRVPADGGGPPRLVSTGSAGWIDINHGVSPDGKTMAITAGPTSLLPTSGGEPRPILGASNYFQSWSPDGKSIAYAGVRPGGVDLFSVGVEGGAERRLTAHRGLDDYPDFSPDGRWIYFNSDRAGGSDIWRMPAEGAGPGDARAERVTDDGQEEWSPHPSPDGKGLIFLSYPKGTGGHPADRDVTIHRMPTPPGPGGSPPAPARPEEVVRFVGGHGSVGPRPWSPDGRRFAFVRYEPPPPTLRVVFFTPADVKVPDGVADRLGRVVEAAERFLVGGMGRAGYPPEVDHPFRRGPDGTPEVLFVKGDRPAAGVLARPDQAAEIIRRATRQHGIAGEGHLWWIFVDLGAPPARFEDWRGMGHSRDGGWAMVNYDAGPGEIRPDLGLEAGFHAEPAFALKGCIHELGHVFGLPHIGPDRSPGAGNSLMGPNHSVYVARKFPNAERVDLTDASAALLWKHPIFTGRSVDRAIQPASKLVAFERTHDRQRDRVVLFGRLASDRPAHSVVVLDDLGRPDDEYWCRGASARLAADGSFRIEIDRPARVDGRHRLLFCFDNGMVVGESDRVVSDDRGEVVKPYRFRDGRFQFLD